jgi:hypothetical protein
MTSTIYDPHWDQHLRALVYTATTEWLAKPNRNKFLMLFSALERAGCTTIAAAKQLRPDSDCLQGVPDELRVIFLKLLAEADRNAGTTHIEEPAYSKFTLHKLAVIMPRRVLCHACILICS